MVIKEITLRHQSFGWIYKTWKCPIFCVFKTTHYFWSRYRVRDLKLWPITQQHWPRRFHLTFRGNSLSPWCPNIVWEEEYSSVPVLRWVISNHPRHSHHCYGIFCFERDHQLCHYLWFVHPNVKQNLISIGKESSWTTNCCETFHGSTTDGLRILCFQGLGVVLPDLQLIFEGTKEYNITKKHTVNYDYEPK